LDPSYDLFENAELKSSLKEIIKEGFEVGLHGSYRGATDEKRLRQEKAIVEESLQAEIRKVRQHWLRYEEKITPYLHDKLFKFDSSIGWNDRMGFRSGCACRYRPYDHLNHKAFSYFITPQVIMDSNIFDYSVKKIGHKVKMAFNFLESLKCYKKSCVSISWHQRVKSSDYGWHKVYERIMDSMFGSSGAMR
jgi:hypothetical protein